MDPLGIDARPFIGVSYNSNSKKIGSGPESCTLNYGSTLRISDWTLQWKGWMNLEFTVSVLFWVLKMTPVLNGKSDSYGTNKKKILPEITLESHVIPKKSKIGNPWSINHPPPKKKVLEISFKKTVPDSHFLKAKESKLAGGLLVLFSLFQVSWALNKKSSRFKQRLLFAHLDVPGS